MTMLSGPMFEATKSGPWRSIHKKLGAHYNIYGCDTASGMNALREFFTTPESVNELNVVLFSTSGVHGSYSTIEQAEKELQAPVDVEDEKSPPDVTFLVIQPRLVCLRYGICEPKNQADIDFLKNLRSRSLEALQKIGWEDAPPNPPGESSQEGK